jgi:hypothetical protein
VRTVNNVVVDNASQVCVVCDLYIIKGTAGSFVSTQSRMIRCKTVQFYLLDGAKTVQFPLVLLLKVVVTLEKLPKVPLVSKAARVLKSELLLMRSAIEFPL